MFVSPEASDDEPPLPGRVEQLERDHEQQQPTGDLERLERDAEQLEHLLATQCEGEDDDTRHGRREEGRATARRHVLALGEGEEDRDVADRDP